MKRKDLPLGDISKHYSLYRRSEYQLKVLTFTP